MLSTYTYPRYAYRRPAEVDMSGTPSRHPVVVVGAGPVGLAAAIDLAQHGVPVLLLDDDDTVSVGSRDLRAQRQHPPMDHARRVVRQVADHDAAARRQQRPEIIPRRVAESHIERLAKARLQRRHRPRIRLERDHGHTLLQEPRRQLA